MRLVRLGLLATIVLAASGCGGTTQSGSVPEGAEFAPASAAFYMVGVTDPASEQWDKADKLLGRFPGRGKFLDEFRKELKQDNLSWERDIKPALPDEVHLVALDFEGDSFVGYAKPKDEARFNKLVESGDDPNVHRKIDGWTVFSDTNKAIDKFASAHSASDRSLADTDAFKDAMERLPADAAVRGYLTGERLYALIAKEAATDPDTQSFQRFSDAFGKLESLSFSAAAEDDGVAVQAGYKTSREQDVGSFSSSLDDAVPSGALLYYSFGNLEDAFNQVLDTADKNFPEFKTQRDQVEGALGFSLVDDLFPLFSKEGGVAIYKGYPIPGVVFLLDVSGNEEKAQNVVKRVTAIAELGGEATTRKFKVEGADATELTFPLEGFSLFLAVADGRAVVTTTEKLLRDTLGGGDKLADDALFTQARDASDAPDKSLGFLYLNLEDGLPWAFDYAEREGETVPPDARANTRPLGSALLYAQKDGKRITLSGFVTIK
jgi:Protein of unknown function (DUF3352)